MRHRNTGRQFGRNSSHRKALFRNLVTALLEHERVETTEAKAKELRGIADRMITLGKKGSLHAKRMAFGYIQSRDVVARLFDTIAPRVANRPGGYTRIIKTRIRNGDSAPMAIIELVDREGSAPYQPKASAPRKEKAAAPAPAAPAVEEKADAPSEEVAAPTETAEAPATEEAVVTEDAPAAETQAEGEEKKAE